MFLLVMIAMILDIIHINKKSEPKKEIKKGMTMIQNHAYSCKCLLCYIRKDNPKFYK